MIQTGLIQNAHGDLVTDVAYDFYGLRLATTSLDQRIKIWRLDERTSSWDVEDDWKAHDAPIVKLSWAHPEYGSIIASASFDRTAKVWEKSPFSASAESAPITDPTPAAGASTTAPLPVRWVERALLIDARGTVRSVEFAPHQLGLKLATIATDNQLRIYECLEQPSLSSWQLTDEIDVLGLPDASSGRSMSRINTVALAPPAHVPATLDPTLVMPALHHTAPGRSGLSQPAAGAGASATNAGTGAGTTSGNATPGITSGSTTSPGIPTVGSREADGGWCISWCKDRYWGEVIAAGCGTSGIIKIIQLTPSRRPSTLLILDPTPPPVTSALSSTRPHGESLAPDTYSVPPSSPTLAITCVAWAPSCGRSYHLIASGGRDGRVLIWKVRPTDATDAEEAVITGKEKSGEKAQDEAKWTATIVADFDQHKSGVSRVEWNITGTVLSSAGNDGRVRLWKATSGSVWRPAGSIGVAQNVETDEAMET